MTDKKNPEHGEKSGAARKLLVAVGEGDKYLHGVHFLKDMFRNVGGTDLVLCYLSREQIYLNRVSGGLYVPESPDKYLDDLREDEAREMLEKVRDLLVKVGYGSERISFKTIERKRALSTQIADEALAGSYDAVVLGRRGRTWFDNMLEGRIETAIDLIGEFLPAPVWICSKPDPQRKGALVCLDGSSSSYRMACHAAEMLRGEEHPVTLLRVKRDKPEGPADSDFLFDSCLKICDWSGFPEESIKTKVIKSNDVSGAILKEADAGRYAVVAMGRYGAGGGKLRNVFRGAVSTSVFAKLTGASLWVGS